MFFCARVLLPYVTCASSSVVFQTTNSTSSPVSLAGLPPTPGFRGLLFSLEMYCTFDDCFPLVKAAAGMASTLNPVQSFAADKNGRVYAVFQDNSLQGFWGTGWAPVPGAGAAQSLDVVTDHFLADAVFFKKTDGTFWESYCGSLTELAG